ncbi:CRISPR-associated protein Csx15 [Mesobacillus jeotgali]|uniref:CRISPR-associated protein Csx15 n=1 Tax=Mesobacillus jeotgali TaxID=129985 RepID=UPI001CFD4EFE|nr:CRISPR-associated protein Csx15 [Mesobacillus jeotgali]
MEFSFSSIPTLFTSPEVTTITNLFALLGGITMIYQGASFLKLRRYYKRRIKELESSVSDEAVYVINMSGHPMTNSSGNWLNGKMVIDVNYGNIHDMHNLEEEANNVMAQLSDQILNQIRHGKPVIYALPGMSILAQVLITKIHAISGSFPIITYATKDGSSGFVWKEPMDLHIYRTNSRPERKTG